MGLRKRVRDDKGIMHGRIGAFLIIPARTASLASLHIDDRANIEGMRMSCHMRSSLGVVLLSVCSCESPNPPGSRVAWERSKDLKAGAATPSSSAAAPAPDAQVIHQHSGPWGSRSHTGVTQFHGPVTEEYSVGSSPIYPGHSVITPGWNATPQTPPGIYPQSGTVYDPRTGQSYPVRRSGAVNQLIER